MKDLFSIIDRPPVGLRRHGSRAIRRRARVDSWLKAISDGARVAGRPCRCSTSGSACLPCAARMLLGYCRFRPGALPFAGDARELHVRPSDLRRPCRTCAERIADEAVLRGHFDVAEMIGESVEKVYAPRRPRWV